MALLSPGSTERTNGKESTRHQGARLNTILGKYQEYFRITLDDLGVASKAETEQLKSRVFSVRPDDEQQIGELEKSWNAEFSKKLQGAYSLNKEFTSQLGKALSEGIISANSAERWEERFRNRNVAYMEKELWVRSEMPRFLQGWRKVAKEREEFIKNPKAKTMLGNDPIFSIIWEKEAFLDLHFEKRKGLLDGAKAKMHAAENKTDHLYQTAERMLQGAAARRYLLEGKVGTWLSRIFQEGASAETIQRFVHGTGSHSLMTLIDNWRQVKERYDHVRGKIRERGEAAAARGFTLLSESKFLGLHYEARIKYMEEAEQRIGESKNVNEELPIFLKIRHAMDTHDWQEADTLIMQARTMELAGKDKERLNSMDSFVKQFSGRTQTTEGMGNLMSAKKRMDHIVTEMASTHPELQPMILRLLGGPNGNRSIHQFRWIVYNNKWCRTHGYLNTDVARKGASQQNKELTKLRATDGEDIGRNDVLDADTEGQHFIRKREYANHKATLMHTNVANSAGTNTLAEWLEHERDPKVLYWTTYCAHENGEPKSANWHDDLFTMLTELRSLSRTVHNAGYMYGGPNGTLLQKGSSLANIRNPGTSGAGRGSFALAA